MGKGIPGKAPLPKEMESATRCRMILLENLWTEHGLVNGRQGLIDIVWPFDTEDPRETIPLFVLVAFEALTPNAPQLFRSDTNAKVHIMSSRAIARVLPGSRYGRFPRKEFDDIC